MIQDHQIGMTKWLEVLLYFRGEKLSCYTKRLNRWTHVCSMRMRSGFGCLLHAKSLFIPSCTLTANDHLLPTHYPASPRSPG